MKRTCPAVYLADGYDTPAWCKCVLPELHQGRHRCASGFQWPTEAMRQRAALVRKLAREAPDA